MIKIETKNAIIALAIRSIINLSMPAGERRVFFESKYMRHFKFQMVLKYCLGQHPYYRSLKCRLINLGICQSYFRRLVLICSKSKIGTYLKQLLGLE